MAFEFILPDIGEGVVEAEVQKWFVKPGDEVREDQPLVEVMTDKATVTIPSPRRGRVTRLHYQEGEIAKVHQPLLELEVASAQKPVPSAPEAPTAAAVPSAPPDAPRAAPGRTERQRALATPAVRAKARQLGIDVNTVHGTGPGGRVTTQDLDQARNGHVAHPEPAATPQRPAPFAEELPEEQPTTEIAHGEEVIPFRGIRRRIAERMAQSKRTAAHFTFVEQVDVSDLVKVEPVMSASRELPAFDSDERRSISRASPTSERRSALRSTGTTSPCSVADAMPM